MRIRSLRDMTADVIQAFVWQNEDVSAEEIVDAISRVSKAFSEVDDGLVFIRNSLSLVFDKEDAEAQGEDKTDEADRHGNDDNAMIVFGKEESAPESDEPKAAPQAKYANPMAAIQTDKIVCLECGAEMQQLTAKHLETHGLTVREYKQKHGYKLGQALCAISLTEKRSAAAKVRGVPAGIVQYQDRARQEKRARLEEAPNEFEPSESNSIEAITSDEFDLVETEPMTADIVESEPMMISETTDSMTAMAE